MPRKRRSFSTPRSRKARRPKADWVYRNNLLNAGAYADGLGTYEPQVIAHSTGVINAQSHVLYDSHNYLSASRSATPLLGFGFTRSHARAAGRKPTILAVEGIVYWEPSVWAAGNLMAIGMRIGAYEQDVSGVFSLDPNYSMWVQQLGAGTDSTNPAYWANAGRQNAWERRVHYGFSDNSVFKVVRVSWRGRRVLNDNECWGLYTELEGTSVNTRTQYWLRSLVSDEG